MRRQFAIISFVLVFIGVLANKGTAQDSTQVDFFDFSLEELMDVKVVSISRQTESIQGAAAAVFVISSEDIRRSGAHSIPEVLRLAPGLNVGRINSHTWAITSRGFNSRFANKLQVLVDGRSIYSPMFSGVYWESSSVMLEDIDRIEIIRGPGATMWGANAVNGVINIITAKAQPEEKDSFVSVQAGSEVLFRGAGRVEGKSSDTGAWRLSAQHLKHAPSALESGDDSFDAWNEQLARFRWDHQLNEQNNLTITSHYFQSEMESDYPDNSPNPPYTMIGYEEVEFSTASFQTIWTWESSPTSGSKLGLYFTHFDREEYLLRELNNIVDLDFQHHFKAHPNHALIWGGIFRYAHDKMHGKPNMTFNPDTYNDRVYGAFLQDDWSVIPDRLNLTLGGKWEYRKNTGNQWQPNARVAWTPNQASTWWGSVARAVRVPNRLNRDVQMDLAFIPPGAMFPDSPATSMSMVGNEEMLSEELIAYETGIRFKPASNLSLDLALFINEYDKLRILEPGEMQPHPIHGLPVMMFPLIVGNGPGGRTHGGELAINWKASKQAQLQLAYSNWDFKAAESESGQDHGMEVMATPRHQVSLRGQFTPSPVWEADIWFRFVDELMADPESVGDYSELDLRFSWFPAPGFNLVLGGRNLLNKDHQEFIYLGMNQHPSWIKRSLYFELKWNF